MAVVAAFTFSLLGVRAAEEHLPSANPQGLNMASKNAAKIFTLLLCVLLCTDVRGARPLERDAEPAVGLTHRKLLWGGYYNWFNSHRDNDGNWDCSPSNSAAAALAASSSGAGSSAASSAAASSACQGYANGGGGNNWSSDNYNEGCDSCGNEGNEGYYG
ncbi:hypothetical protein WJX73_004829 [Symbiochloris irregularis]|uniref:Uncharacterized protein n=1 Tax=Symbiochloris irregularis TaxID=706552 RepID=A0AAW1NR05_9CHLO